MTVYFALLAVAIVVASVVAIVRVVLSDPDPRDERQRWADTREAFGRIGAERNRERRP